MLEELCRTAFYTVCRETEEKTPLVALKGKPWKKKNEFEGFFLPLAAFNGMRYLYKKQLILKEAAS